MAIEQSGNAGQSKSNIGLSVLIGALTGGPVGAGLGLLSAKNPALGTIDSAIGRKLNNSSSTSPTPEHASTLDDGIGALTHPDVPRHIADAAAPVLFAAKYHGAQGLPYNHLFSPPEEMQ